MNLLSPCYVVPEIFSHEMMYPGIISLRDLAYGRRCPTLKGSCIHDPILCHRGCGVLFPGLPVIVNMVHHNTDLQFFCFCWKATNFSSTVTILHKTLIVLRLFCPNLSIFLNVFIYLRYRLFCVIQWCVCSVFLVFIIIIFRGLIVIAHSLSLVTFTSAKSLCNFCILSALPFTLL
jgi:hypothetical protein